MNTPRKPQLPETAPRQPPQGPHPLNRPDERKEGGPDHGKVRKAEETRQTLKEDAKSEEDAKSAS